MTEIANTGLFKKFEQWTNGHETQLKNTQEKLIDINQSQISINEGLDSIFSDENFNNSPELQQEANELESLYKGFRNAEATAKLLQVSKENTLGLTFNFMDGKDASKDNDYDAQLALLAQGDIEARNKDDNPNLSLEEFTNYEMQLVDEDDENYQQYLDTTQATFTALDIDENSELDLEEMKNYYQLIDESDGTKDGIITTESAFEEPVTIKIDKWDSKEKNNIDCPTRLIYNVFGVSYYSDEGQEYFKQLQEINPDLDLNNLQPGMTIKLINQKG